MWLKPIPLPQMFRSRAVAGKHLVPSDVPAVGTVTVKVLSTADVTKSATTVVTLLNAAPTSNSGLPFTIAVTGLKLTDRKSVV